MKPRGRARASTMNLAEAKASRTKHATKHTKETRIKEKKTEQARMKPRERARTSKMNSLAIHSLTGVFQLQTISLSPPLSAPLSLLSLYDLLAPSKYDQLLQ